MHAKCSSARKCKSAALCCAVISQKAETRKRKGKKDKEQEENKKTKTTYAEKTSNNLGAGILHKK
jgi:hypothetical protein